MDCRVVVEAAVPVYDVGTADEAVRIAISKTGGMLNPDLSYVEINVGSRTSPAGEALEPAFVVADEALVALELEMTVFNVQRTEHAARIARKEIGQRMHDVPLDVLDVSVLDEDTEGTDGENEGNSADDETRRTVAGNGPEDRRRDETDGSGVLDPDEDTDAEPMDASSDGPDESEGTDASGDGTDTNGGTTDEIDDGDEDDILPEFEDLLDE